MAWRDTLRNLRLVRFFVNILNKFKVLPQYLPIISTVLSASQTFIEKWLNYIVTSNQKKGEEVIKKQEEIQKKTEEEVTKPVQQQNPDVIRDQLRNRYKK